jgi:MoaA/NifB/PqqE/SkfB family radical SAM enzyme
VHIKFNLYTLKIDQIKRLDEKYEGIMDVVVTGGEPLLRSDLEEILSYITRQNPSCPIVKDYIGKS